MPAAHPPPGGASARGYTHFDTIASISSPDSDASSSIDRTASTSVLPASHHETRNIPSTPRRATDKPTNDSSIFVGSLPPNMDHVQLSYRLADHLSPHLDTKRVKVIRDNRGGVCAFVQCKDASAAAKFIQTVATNPLPLFMGRSLRFELARSSRTLLFSYRAPTHTIEGTGTVEQLEPATAMRIFRPVGDRFVSILYNSEAVQYQHPRSHISELGPPECPLDAGGLLISPLRYDSQTLQKVVNAFGPIEHFGLYQPVDGECSHPKPHDASKLPGMSSECWEVKWEQREDSMAALMALRSVPHLSVSWAHLVGQRTGMDNNTGSPFASSQAHAFNAMTPSGWVSPIRASRRQARGPSFPPVFRQPNSSGSPNVGRLSSNAVTLFSTGTPTRTPATVSRVNEDVRNSEVGDWSAVSPINLSRPLVSTPSTNAARSPTIPRSVVAVMGGGSPVLVASHTRVPDAGGKARWYEDDFPPLASGEEEADNMPHFLRSGPPLRNMLRSTHIGSNTSSLSISTTDAASGQRPASANPEPSSAQKFRASVPLEHSFSALSMTRDDTAKSEATLMTPDTGAEIITPIDCDTAIYSPQIHEDRTFGEDSIPLELVTSSVHQQKDLDHTTVFIGGMEMYGPNAWDELRVRAVFERFGVIDSVKFIRPFNKKSAFAFVRYRNTESSARAVAVEHNKVYNGRQLRVQIRESNPERSSFVFPKDIRLNRPPGGRTSRPHYDGGRSRQRLMTGSSRRSTDSTDRLNIPRRGRRGYYSDSTSPPGSFASTYPTTAAPTPDPVLSVPAVSPNQHIRASPRLASVGESAIPVNGPRAIVPPPPTHAGYFVPQPWMLQPFTYPLPFAPYSGYIVPPPPGANLDGSALPPSGSQPFYPYSYPVVVPHTGSHMSRLTDIDQHVRPAAPLLPTSFVQGEHGLMPVYPPEALDRYISRASASALSASSPAERAGMNQGGTTSGQGSWSGFGYGYPPAGHAPAMIHTPSSPGRIPGTMGWFAPPLTYPPHVTSQQTPPGVSPPSSLNVNTFFTGNTGLASASPHPAPLRGPRHEEAGTPLGPSRRLSAQNREYYADVRVPVIGSGPPAVPAVRHGTRQVGLVHRKGAASMEQIASQEGTMPMATSTDGVSPSVNESRSSPVISTRTASHSAATSVSRPV